MFIAWQPPENYTGLRLGDMRNFVIFHVHHTTYSIMVSPGRPLPHLCAVHTCLHDLANLDSPESPAAFLTSE
jgi:hypothetical protein